MPSLTDFEILKEAADTRSLLSLKGWKGAGTDKVGFASISGGFFSFKDGKTKRRGEIAGYWSTTDYEDYAVRLKLDGSTSESSLSGLSKQYGFSVRCISQATSKQSRDIAIDSRTEKILETVTIGKQKWLAENMNIKTVKSYCPGDDEANCGTYGRLYEWSAAQMACPPGFRLPNAADFEELVRSGEYSKLNPVYAGYRNSKSGFELIDIRSDLWSASAVGNSARYWYFKNGDGKLNNAKYSKTGAMSVRCIEGALTQNFSYSQIVDDRDNQIYKTVKIGKQIWMAQNLNLAMGGSYCYDNDEANCDIYGRLYEWTDAANICPDDFHLPDDNEWLALRNYVSSNGDGRIGTDLRSVEYWKRKPGADLFGLNVLPSGHYSRVDDSFGRLGERSYMWSATEIDSDSASHWAVVGDMENLLRVTVYKKNARAVRCVHD